MTRPTKDKLLLMAVVVAGVFALAIYCFAFSTTAGQAVFWILVLFQLVAARRLFASGALPQPALLPKIRRKWNLKSLTLGLLCFPTAILWAAGYGLAVNRRVVSDTWSNAYLLLLAPAALLVLTGGFLIMRSFWGKDP